MTSRGQSGSCATLPTRAIDRLVAYQELRETLHADVYAAYLAGFTQADISRASGLQRQWVGVIIDRAKAAAEE